MKEVVNFNIIENHVKDYPLEDIIRDYTDNVLTIVEIWEKYDITEKRWGRDVLPLLKEQGVPLRGRKATKKTASKFKYYSYMKSIGKFRVIRVFNKKQYVFGMFETEEEAKERVRELEANNWDGLLC